MVDGSGMAQKEPGIPVMIHVKCGRTRWMRYVE